MNKLNCRKYKLFTLGFILLFFFLSGCSEQASNESSEEVEKTEEVEKKKDIHHYGIDTELLDIESNITLELFEEEKVIPADLVVIDNKVKLSLPSELAESITISVDSESKEKGIFDAEIEYFPYDDEVEFGGFFIDLTIEEKPLGTKLIADIYHDRPYDVDLLEKYYPATANKFDALTFSHGEENSKYIFFKSFEDDVLMKFYGNVYSEVASKQLESLLCSIAASVEYIN